MTKRIIFYDTFACESRVLNLSQTAMIKKFIKLQTKIPYHVGACITDKIGRFEMQLDIVSPYKYELSFFINKQYMFGNIYFHKDMFPERYCPKRKA